MSTNATQLKRLATMLAKLSEEDRAALLALYTPTPAPTRPKAQKEARECLCGCGGTTGSRFVPGHDAKLKGALLRAHRANELTTEQVALVEELGWGRFVYSPASL